MNANGRKPRSGDSTPAIVSLLSPLRGLMDAVNQVPRACARGYMLPPLRGYSRTK